MILTQTDVDAARKELARRSLADFTKQAWHVLEPGKELKWGWVLDAICEHLEAVSDGKIRRLLINVPPGSMKSLLVSVMWPAWEWGPRNMPTLRYLATAHKQELAIRDNQKCRRLILSEWYQDRWPVELTSDQNAKTKFENSQYGVREVSSFTSLTGIRGDRIILDDPHSVNDANSIAALNEAAISFKEALPSRINDDKSAIVIIKQRISINDVSALAIEQGYEHLMVPMRFEPNRACTTSIGWKDPRKEEGELMFPERFTAEMVEELEKGTNSFAVAGQLQQNPTPREGALFPVDRIGLYHELPPLSWTAIFADTAMKDGKQNDYSVLQLWGKAKDPALGIYLIDQVRGKWKAPKLLSVAKDFFLEHQSNLFREMYIEDKSSGIGLIQEFEDIGIPVHPLKPEKNKYQRANDALLSIERGKTHIPANAHFTNEFLLEAQYFDGLGTTNDDMMDTYMYAIQVMKEDDVSEMARGFFGYE